MAKKVGVRNTKAEILEAYQELKKEKSALQSQFNKLNQSKVNNSSINSNSAKPVITSHSNKPKMQHTIQTLMTLQAGFGGVVSELSEQLTQEATKLEELQQAVTTEQEKLQELHDLEEVEEDTLDTLIIRYQQTEKAFQEELNQQKETLEQQWQDQQKAWQKEQEELKQQIQERNENYKKSRFRDQESYEYNLELQREIEQEEYEQRQQDLYQVLDELQEQKQKEWEERETALAEQEKEEAEVKAKVEAFPEELKGAIKKSKEAGHYIGTSQARVKADLFAKEVEGQKQFYQLRIQSLSETIQNQENRIKNISEQLDSALKQVQDLAVKAIEGSSNASSFQAMKEIALEQAKTQQKSK